MSIGSRVKQTRKRLGLTQEDLAASIGVTKGAIANYENEVSTPKIELLLKLMDVLQVDANYLYQDDIRFLEKRKPTLVSESGPLDPLNARLNELLCQANPDTKKAMIALLEQFQTKE